MIEIVAIENDLVHLGCVIWIQSLLFKSHMRIPSERSFITTVCYELWGAETLARRVVRKHKNVTFQAVTPEKKSAAEELFNLWMIKKKLPDSWRSEKMVKFNTYLNGAITAARKKIDLDIKEEKIFDKNNTDSESDLAVGNTKKIKNPVRPTIKTSDQQSNKENSELKSSDPTVTVSKHFNRLSRYKINPRRKTMFKEITLVLTRKLMVL